jgi:hypothetical protein
VPFKIKETGTCIEVPDFDKVVHTARDAAVATVVQHDRVDLLCVTLKAMLELTGRDLPDAHGTIIRAGDKRVTICGNGAYAVMVPTERTDEVWVVAIVCWWTSLHDASVARLRQLPNAES